MIHSALELGAPEVQVCESFPSGLRTETGDDSMAEVLKVRKGDELERLSTGVEGEGVVFASLRVVDADGEVSGASGGCSDRGLEIASSSVLCELVICF